MGATKDRRSSRRRTRQPWEVVMIRTRKRQLIHVNCPSCRKRCAIRYWDPRAERGVCYECVPRDIRHLIPKQTDSDPDARPMALG